MANDLESLLARAAKGDVLPAYLFTGDAELPARDAARQLAELIVPEADRSFNLAKYDGASTRPSEVSDDLCSISLLGGRRVVLVLGATFLAGKRDLSEVVNELVDVWEQGRTEDSAKKAVVLFSEAGFSLSDLAQGTKKALDELHKAFGLRVTRGDRVDRWRAALHAKLSAERREIPPPSGGVALLADALASGRSSSNTLILTARKVERTHPVVREIRERGAVLSLDLAPGKEGDRQLAAILDRLVRDAGLELAGDARAALLDRLPPDPARVEREVEKLAAYAGAARTVDLEAVTALVPRDREDPIYLLQGSLGDRNLSEALGRARSLVAGSSNEPVGEVMRLMAALASEARRLLRARVLLDGPFARDFLRNTSSRDFEDRIFSKLGDVPGAGPLAQGHPFRCYRTFQGALRFQTAELVRMLRSLAGLDRALKSAPSDPALLLERFLIDILAPSART